MSETEIKRLVSSVKSKSDNNMNLYEHFEKLLLTKMEINDDKKFLDLLEDISIRIKKTGHYIDKNECVEALRNYLTEYNKNVNSKKLIVEDIVKKPDDDQPKVGYVPDYHNIFQTLEWAGISLEEKESFMLTNSLRNLVYNKNLTSAVFWGKIYGTKNDYYIAEVTGGEYPEPVNPEPELEKRGEDGINKSIYFVCTDLTGEWIELSDVRPSMLIASRKIRYIFSGDLNKKICTNPHFPGKEIDYLRCQIARINHGTYIVPNVNSYTFDKEAQYKQLEQNPEAKPLKHNDYLNMKNWIHYLPGILKEGRINHFDREPPKEDMDKEIFMKSIIASDPFDIRMQSITEDKNIFSLVPNVKIPSWKMQYVYDDKIYINPEIKKNEDPDAEQKDNTVNYTMVCLRSLRWPGSYTVKAKNQIFRFYFGWGLKFAEYSMGQTFVYEHFPNIPNDPDDAVEYPEPNSPPHEEENKDKNQNQENIEDN